MSFNRWQSSPDPRIAARARRRIVALARHTTASALFALLLASSATTSAQARATWNYPLLPHVKALAFFPETPNDAQPTSIQLSSTYNECWSVASAGLTDTAHVLVTLTSCPATTDSVYGWVRGFDLGVLSAGPHSLTVHATVLNPGAPSTEEEITVPFDVVRGAPPPPPPPPSDTSNTVVMGFEILPPNPLITDEITARVNGRYPFACGEIASAAAVDPQNLAMTIRPGATCADTSHVWVQDFALGPYSAGEHLVHLDVTCERASGTTHELYTLRFTVTDPNAPPPPPPPPPGDSLKAALSPGHPNPFRAETQFSVSIKDPQRAEVAVFDLSGRRVTTVFRGMLPAGTSQLAWDGRRADGRRAPGGIYFTRLTLPDRVVTRRVVLLTPP